MQCSLKSRYTDCECMFQFIEIGYTKPSGYGKKLKMSVLCDLMVLQTNAVEL